MSDLHGITDIRPAIERTVFWLTSEYEARTDMYWPTDAERAAGGYRRPVTDSRLRRSAWRPGGR